MPITPLHFGPGLLLKAALGARMSLLAFVAVQVVIDLETLWYMLRGDWPIHRFLHTYAGATLAAVPALFLVRRVPAFAVARWNRRVADEGVSTWGVRERTPWGALGVGALLGGWSHVLLDSLMHPDMRPLAPFADGNALLGTLGLGWLNGACVGAALLGLAWLTVTARRR